MADDREDDSRRIAEARELPGRMAYAQTREEAISDSEKLAIEVIADRIQHAELPPSALDVSFQVLSEQLIVVNAFGGQTPSSARVPWTRLSQARSGSRKPSSPMGTSALQSCLPPR